MKRCLKKRWHSIPVGIITAVLLVSLLAGGVFASYELFIGNAKVTVNEAFTISNTGGDDESAYTRDGSTITWDVSLYAGETKTLNILVSNASSSDLTVGASSSGGLNGVTGTWSGLGVVTGGGNLVITLEVTAADDAPPDYQEIYITITRG